MSELRFSSVDEALQYLANETGQEIRIAKEKDFKVDDEIVFTVGPFKGFNGVVKKISGDNGDIGFKIFDKDVVAYDIPFEYFVHKSEYSGKQINAAEQRRGIKEDFITAEDAISDFITELAVSHGKLKAAIKPFLTIYTLKNPRGLSEAFETVNSAVAELQNSDLENLREVLKAAPFGDVYKR